MLAVVVFRDPRSLSIWYYTCAIRTLHNWVIGSYMYEFITLCSVWLCECIPIGSLLFFLTYSAVQVCWNRSCRHHKVVSCVWSFSVCIHTIFVTHIGSAIMLCVHDSDVIHRYVLH